MTRDQIKQVIHDVIERHQRIKFNSGYPLIVGTDEAVDSIMKLWDQGFVYDIKEGTK